jgi:hypothetical protein
MIFHDLGGATPGTAKTIKGLAKNASGKGARDATHTTCTGKPIRNAQMLLPTPLHRRITRMRASAMSLVTGLRLENLERSTTYDRNQRANASFRDHGSMMGGGQSGCPRPKFREGDPQIYFINFRDYHLNFAIISTIKLLFITTFTTHRQR